MRLVAYAGTVVALLFYLVVVAFVLIGFGFLHDRFFGIPSSEMELQERHRRNVLLVTW